MFRKTDQALPIFEFTGKLKETCEELAGRHIGAEQGGGEQMRRGPSGVPAMLPWTPDSPVRAIAIIPLSY